MPKTPMPPEDYFAQGDYLRDHFERVPEHRGKFHPEPCSECGSPMAYDSSFVDRGQCEHLKTGNRAHMKGVNLTGCHSEWKCINQECAHRFCGVMPDTQFLALTGQAKIALRNIEAQKKTS